MLNAFPPAYLYQQYALDSNLQALVAGINAYQQGLTNRLLGFNLPIYPQLVGPAPPSLLDWVALGLYGMLRPVFIYASGGVPGGENAVYDSGEYDSFIYDGGGGSSTYSYQLATDDQFQRCLTWNFYKGDGFQFNARWLKRRVERFLQGTNGWDPGVLLNGWANVQDTYDVSVVFTATEVTITIPPTYGTVGQILQQAFTTGGVLNVPVEYGYTVVIS